MRLIYLLLILTIPFKVSAQIKPADQQYIPQENLLLNPGLEQGRVNWTISGTATVSLEQTASAVLAGLSSLKIVASSQTFEVAQFTTKSASSLNGMQAMASVRVKTNQSGVQVCSIENSVHVKCVSVDSTNQAKEYIIPFVFNSTNNGIVIKGSSGTGTTYIDDAYVGIMPANRMPEISQAQLAGEAYIAGTTNCGWSRTSTTLGAFGTDADCPGPTIVKQNVGVWQTTDTDLPRFTINNLPAGDYLAKFQLAGFMGVGASSVFAINDGSTTCYPVRGNDSSAFVAGVLVECSFSYTTLGNRSFELYGASTSSTLNIDNNETLPPQGVKFILEYYPPTSKVYSGATIYPAAHVVGEVTYSSGSTLNIGGSPMQNNSMTVSSTGDVLNVCSNYSLGTGAGCVSGNKAVGASFPNKGKGTYEVCQAYGAQNTGSAINGDSFTISGFTFNIGSGTPLQSFAGELYSYPTNYGGRASNHDYCVTIVNPTQDRINVTFNAPAATYSYATLFANNLLYTRVKYYPPKDNPIIGTFEGIEKCEDDYECTDTFSAKVSSAGVVSDENLDWINGNCTNANPRVCSFNTSIFTVAPNCVAVAGTSGKIVNFNAASISSTVIGISTFNDVGGAEQVETQLICQKQGSDYKPKTAKAATTNEMMYVPNVTRPKTCYYAFGGASATLASPTVCAASPCVEMYDSCSAGTPPIRTNIGNYQDITFANGTWKANTFLDCRCEAYLLTTNAERECSTTFQTGDNTITTNSSGGAVVNYFTHTSAGSSSDTYAKITCTADAP